MEEKIMLHRRTRNENAKRCLARTRESQRLKRKFSISIEEGQARYGTNAKCYCAEDTLQMYYSAPHRNSPHRNSVPPPILPLVPARVDRLVDLPAHDDDLPRDRVVRARSRALVVQVVGLEVLVDPAVPGPIPLTTENRH